jgi:2-keto-4-pentenoate hydratase/2-oxohepta-3-ene-1,7-dioic acid hydratase in catechol pathway
MRLVTFTHRESTRLGVMAQDTVVDLAQAAPKLPRGMVAFLEAGPEAIEAARSAARRPTAVIALEAVHLNAPILRPGKFLGIGGNYPSLTQAMPDQPVPQDPPAAGRQIWFNKQVSCINGPFDPIVLPRLSEQIIYENELALVIGRQCRRIPPEQARSAIAGYLICNDVTAIDLAFRLPNVTLGKSFDTHGPIGPWLVSADEIGDPHALNVRTYVNGEERQSGGTSQMFLNCYDMVAFLSQYFTLEPGDIVTTGTPPQPTHYLKTGDVVRCEIDRIGHIENRVVASSP